MLGELCVLHEYDQVMDFFIAIGLSKSHCKKHAENSFLKKSVRAKAVLSCSLDLLNPNLIHCQYEGEAPKIIQEDDDFVVIHKPANVHGHALNYTEKDNVLSWLRSIGRADLLTISQESHERGLLYRLDYATSGLLIYVKHQWLHDDLRHHFFSTVHTKRYLAVTTKRPEIEGAQTAWFDLTGKKVRAHEAYRSGRIEGGLKLEVLEELDGKFLVMIELEHGHRHQIRAHLTMLGCPILGDRLYGGEEAQRLCLHAYEYHIDKRLKAKDCDLGFGLNFLYLNRNL